jgi:hypothetical protein
VGPEDSDSLPTAAGERVLVVASYPPIPTAGAAVAVEMVRDLWAQGARPVVSSPRTSAADHDIAVFGVLAGRRLSQLGAATGARRLVLCVEHGFPVAASARLGTSLPALQQLTIRGITQALAAFDHATIVVCGDTGVPEHLLAPLLTAATVTVRRPAASGAAGVTPLGPGYPDALETGRLVAARVARRALGPSYPRARAIAARAARSARTLARPG